jgi:hypothetical protein
VHSYNFPDDRKLLKLLGTQNSLEYWRVLFNDDSFIVYSIFLLETLQTALRGGDVYYWFVSGFGKVDHLQNPYASGFDNPIMGSIVTGTVQFFFAYRVWVLSDRRAWWYCVIIVVVSQLSISNTSQTSFCS